jgi:AraC-like DNA-binding protein
MERAGVVNEFSSLNGEYYCASEIFNHKKLEVGETRFKIPRAWGTGESRCIMLNSSTGIGFNEISLAHRTQLVAKSKGPVYRMMLCLGDNMKWEEVHSRSTIQLTAGEGVLCQIEETTEICPHGPEFNYQWVHILIPPEKLENLLFSLPVDKNIFQYAYRNIKISYFKLPQESKVIIEQAARCPYKGAIKRMYIESKLTELLAVCLYSLIEKNPSDANTIKLSRSDLNSIHRAKEILDKSISSGISLAALARFVCLNESKLKSGFKQVFGIPVYTYLVNRRMERARILLEFDNMRVKEVAHMVGYANGNSFSKAFRKKYGFNPSDCLNSEKNGFF